jgi:DNA-binding MarR family transcriptional regulator
MSALASQAGASLSAMTRLVDGLERRGWITRARPGDDRRRVVAKLTAAGRREATRLRAETEAIISTVLRRIPAAKHPQVLEAVRLLRTAMDELRESGRSCCAS